MNQENGRLKIAFLTSHDPKDRRTWSGTVYYMAQALQKHCGELTYIGPIQYPKQELLGKIFHRSSQLFLKKNVMYEHGIPVAKKCAKVAARRIAKDSFDVIIAPVGETEIA